MQEDYFKAKEYAEEEEDYSDVTIRLYDPSDVDFMAWATDENVCRFSGWYPTTYASKRKTTKHILQSVIPHPWYRAICIKSRAIGEIVVTPNYGSGGCRAEVGYSIGSKYWGKEIMTRALKLAVSTIFIDLPCLRRLEAVADVENPASQRVLEKVGFQREGVVRSYYLNKGKPMGKPMDMVMFSLLPSDPPLLNLSSLAK